LLHDALHDLAVVEGVSFVAGPTCGIYLAQMGAEVIRFDQVGGGPDYRRWPLSPEGESFYWESLNKGKKSVAIDLGRPEGRELAQRLAASTGLFVTNYPVGGFLSYERLKPLRADLIALRIMGWADGKPAVDYTVNAAVGVPLMTGPEDAKGPVNHMLAAWDLLTGAYAAFSLVTAERARRADGLGREVRIPLADVAMASMGHLGFIPEALLGTGDRPRVGNNLYGARDRGDLSSYSAGHEPIFAIHHHQKLARRQLIELSRAGIAPLRGCQPVRRVFQDEEGAKPRHSTMLL